MDRWLSKARVLPELPGSTGYLREAEPGQTPPLFLSNCIRVLLGKPGTEDTGSKSGQAIDNNGLRSPKGSYWPILVREERRQLEIVAGQLQIGLGTGAALILGLAESAPLTAEEVAVTGKGQFSRGLQNLIRPAVQVILSNLKSADILASGLYDVNAHVVDLHINLTAPRVSGSCIYEMGLK